MYDMMITIMMMVHMIYIYIIQRMISKTFLRLKVYIMERIADQMSAEYDSIIDTTFFNYYKRWDISEDPQVIYSKPLSPFLHLNSFSDTNVRIIMNQHLMNRKVFSCRTFLFIKHHLIIISYNY